MLYGGIYVDNADLTVATASDPEGDDAQWLWRDVLAIKVAANNTEIESYTYWADIRSQRIVPTVHKKLWFIYKTDSANSAGMDMRLSFRTLVRLM